MPLISVRKLFAAALGLATLCLTAFFFGTPAARAEVEELCGLRIESKDSLGFSKTEKGWLCGEEGHPAWSDLPESQKKFFLKNFLQARGFHHPEFISTPEVLVVKTGEQSKVKKFTVSGAPLQFNPAKRRLLIGSLLTPGTLDDTATWAKRTLQTMGYPCPEVNAEADVATGTLSLTVAPGETYQFQHMESVGGVDLPHQVLDRFTAFVEGQPFDIRLLEVSSSRILNQDLYLSSYYDIRCQANTHPTIVRRFVPAQPRLLTVGAGFDTEQGPIFRARFRRMRIGHSSDSLDTTLFASFRDQSLDFRYNWYFLRDLSARMHLRPQITFEREDEKSFRTISVRPALPLVTGWEFYHYGLEVEAGPALDYTLTQRGLGLRKSTKLSITQSLNATSHLYEFYLTDPKQGWNIGFDGNTQLAGLSSEQTIQRAVVHYHWLWNLGGFDPSLLILGWRGMLGTFFFDQRQTVSPDIAVKDRFFLGGDGDARGFGRKQIPGDEIGFLTSLYQGIELRTATLFSLPLQPFVFFDFAKGGRRRGELDRPNYLSPGFGIRYNSPIGSLRATLGRGYVTNPEANSPEGGLKFFFSLGKEF